MRAERATAGFSAAAIAVAFAFAPGKLTAREVLFLVAAVAILALTFAPMLPWLNRLPRVGAPRVTVVLSFEPSYPGAPEELLMERVPGSIIAPRILRVGFVNGGPSRVHRTLVNVLVPAGLDIEGCDYRGDTGESHGRAMPPTVLDGTPTHFWADKDVDLPVGALLMHYRLTVRDVASVGESYRLRMTYDSEDLYGGERAVEETVRIVDPPGGSDDT
jgi:hypothetical protein